MKTTLIAVCFILASCGFAVSGHRLTEKQQISLEDKSNEVMAYNFEAQREFQTKTSRKQRELESAKESILKDLGLDPKKYMIQAIGPSFKVLSIKTGQEER